MKKHTELSKSDQAARVHRYREFRRAGYGALAAWMSALRHVHFVKDLSASVRASAKRSKAAKQGWKQRRESNSLSIPA